MCKAREEAIINKKYLKLRNRHKTLKKKNGIDYSKKDNEKFFDDILTFNQFKLLSKKPCFYCGEINDKPWEDKSSKKGILYLVSDTKVFRNGLDRIKNDKQYNVSNVIPCCTDCNMLRGTRTQAQLFIKLRKIELHMNKKKIR